MKNDVFCKVITQACRRPWNSRRDPHRLGQMDRLWTFTCRLGL